MAVSAHLVAAGPMECWGDTNMVCGQAFLTSSTILLSGASIAEALGFLCLAKTWRQLQQDQTTPHLQPLAGQGSGSFKLPWPTLSVDTKTTPHIR
jgi:hypothetical protein